MRASIRMGSLLGIPLSINWSVLLVAWLIAFSLAGQLLPAQVPGLSAALYWAAGAIVALLLFGSLLAHELSHAIVARREGLNVSGITLWLLGGVTRMEGDPRSPGAEARIAGAGPLASFGLALGFGAVALGFGLAPASDVIALAFASATWLALVNLILAVFNLLPGAPLDGGRIARAVLWRLGRDKLRATRLATGLGQLLGYGLVALGLVQAFTGDVGGIWLVLLGFFLATAASAERRSTELSESLRGVRVGDVMTRQPLRAPASLTVDTFEGAATSEGDSTWLLTEPGGAVVSVLGLERLRLVRGDDRRTKRVGELATPLDQSPIAYADELVTDVLARLAGETAFAVVRERTAASTDIVGLLTPEDLRRTLERVHARGHNTASTGGERSEERALP